MDNRFVALQGNTTSDARCRRALRRLSAHELLTTEGGELRVKPCCQIRKDGSLPMDQHSSVS